MKTILVEDNPADARLLELMLRDSAGGLAAPATVGRLDAALERLQREPFDLILLDLGLPDSQGMDTLERMREAGSDLPIVVLTGRDDPEFAVEAVRRGAQDYLVKGRFDRELLERTVRYAVERKQAQRSLQRERQRLRDVLEALPVMVCLLTPDFRVAFANSLFRREFGEVQGRRCHEYLLGGPERCDSCETGSVLQTGQPHRWKCRSPDGRKTFDVHDLPFTDSDGSPMILKMTLDVTEVRNAQAALQEANANLERRVAERTAELSARNEELARFNRAMVGRELRMIELKKEINELCARAGQPPRHAVPPDS